MYVCMGNKRILLYERGTHAHVNHHFSSLDFLATSTIFPTETLNAPLSCSNGDEYIVCFGPLFNGSRCFDED